MFSSIPSRSKSPRSRLGLLLGTGLAISVGASIFLAFVAKTPVLLLVRGQEVTLVLVFFVVSVVMARRPSFASRARMITVVALHACALLIVGHRNLEIDRVRARVLAAPDEQLQRLGRHIVIGYRRPSEVEPLLLRGAVGGLFVSGLNAEGRTANELAEEIVHLMKGRPLLVAADQEGGPVSRLSPTIPAPPSLSLFVEGGRVNSVEIGKHAREVARDLRSLGVNVNFAPVVDLKPSREGLGLHTALAMRAVSSDPEVVAEASEAYARALSEGGVAPTFKHFPGLGSVREDTHLFAGELASSVEDLERSDWVPFRRGASLSTAIMMVGHVRLSSADPVRIATRSRPIVTGLLRDRIGHRGVVITDDLCMWPTFFGSGGIGAAAVDALRAGVDLLLVSYDGEQAYRVLGALIDADDRGELDREALAESDGRIASLRIALGLPKTFD